MKEKLPPILYRGDSDPNGTRQLKESLSLVGTGYLHTNLSNGGDGREIFFMSPEDLIRKHVDVGWDKTHFLSFSECPHIALKFASSDNSRQLTISPNHNWDAIVIQLNRDKFNSVVEIEEGIYECKFSGQSPEGSVGNGIFRRLAKSIIGTQTVTVLLIDVASYLKSRPLKESTNEAFKKASRDREWLILPRDPLPELGEFTSLLDDGCLSKIDYYTYR